MLLRFGTNLTAVHTQAKKLIKSSLMQTGRGAYFVDADHINLSCVDKFINSSVFLRLMLPIILVENQILLI
ncbi:MAG: hypothetical protein DRI44_05915 [Chlamydiae bacterium]|nr:MAG: hypothetical protein DRI44_05915 [Chlamydiota bacterium]